jgi:polyisoprenoid-binding protein YceI
METRYTSRAWATLFSAAVVTLTFAPAAFSQSQDRGARQKIYEPGDLELGASQVVVFVGKTGFGHEHAVSGRLKSGNLVLDPRSPGGEIVFDLTSFDADSDAARKYLGLEGSSDTETRRQVNENMYGKAVLNVSKHPTATFTLTSVKPLQEPSPQKLPQLELTGELTLHDVKREVRVVADWEEKQGWIHLRGGFPLLQTDYGITPFSKAFGAVGVTDELKVYGDFWFAKERRVVEVKAAQSGRRVRQ